MTHEPDYDEDERFECADCGELFWELDENGLCEECADPEGYYDSSDTAMLKEHGTWGL